MYIPNSMCVVKSFYFHILHHPNEMGVETRREMCERMLTTDVYLRDVSLHAYDKNEGFLFLRADLRTIL